MYIVIRLIIALFISILFILITKKRIKNRCIKLFIAIVPFIVISTVLVFLPFENTFLKFSSPEKVYQYFNFGNDAIKIVVAGKESNLVIGDKNGSDIYYIVPKNGESWEIGVTSDTKKVARKTQDGFLILVHHYVKSNDYFITVIDSQNKIEDISDSKQSDFITYDYSQKHTNSPYTSYYANIQDFDEQYWINVNGEKISFNVN